MRYTRLEEDMEGNMIVQEYFLEKILVRFTIDLILKQGLGFSAFELETILNKIFKFKCAVKLENDSTYVIIFFTEDKEVGIFEYKKII